MTMTQEPTALDRVLARVAAAAPGGNAMPPSMVPAPNAPPQPVAPVPAQADDIHTQLADIASVLAELDQRVSTLESAAVDDTLAEGDVMMAAALPPFQGATPAADLTAEQRRALADKNVAMSDGSFPIRNQTDLEKATRALGRASNPDAVKAHIRTRAEALGLTAWLKEHTSWAK